MPITITRDAHTKLINLVKAIQDKQRDFSAFREKLETIDTAYGKHQVKIPSTGEDQPDEIATKVPLVNAEVDDTISFLSSIFVTKYPLFPVVGEEGNTEDALMLQAILDRDARQQRWGRQILKFLVVASRYNIGAIEVEGTETRNVKIQNKEEVAGDTYDLDFEFTPTSKLKAIDMYNLLFDYRVAPADVPMDGEYIGYNEIISKTKLKAIGNDLSRRQVAYNLQEAYTSNLPDISEYWNEPPEIITSNLQKRNTDVVDWFNWMGILKTSSESLKLSNSSYFLTRLYVRIIPSEFGISIPGKNNHPTIIKLFIVNLEWIIGYEEVITPLDMLPILIADLREDGFDYQTKSPGENMLPYQQTATELLHVRLGGARRALNDRAIYNATYLNPSQVNSRNPSAKIPMKTKLQNSGEMPRPSDLYYSIPFESQGTLGTISDLSTILSIKDQVNGSNFASRGEHKKGNRSASEYIGLENKGDQKQIPMALRIEEQVMMPMKLILKINVLKSNIIDKKILDEVSGNTVNVNTAKLRQSMLGFKLADGLIPKSTIQDPEIMSMAIQFIQNNEQLNIEYEVPKIFGSFMSLYNIDIAKYKRKEPLNPNSNNGEQNDTARTPTETVDTPIRGT